MERAICAALAGVLVRALDVVTELGAALATGRLAAVEDADAAARVDAEPGVDVVAGVATAAGVEVVAGVDADSGVDVVAGVAPVDFVEAVAGADDGVAEVDAGAFCVAAGGILFFPDFSCRGGVFCILGLLKLDPAGQDRKPYRQCSSFEKQRDWLAERLPTYRKEAENLVRQATALVPPSRW